MIQPRPPTDRRVNEYTKICAGDTDVTLERSLRALKDLTGKKWKRMLLACREHPGRWPWIQVHLDRLIVEGPELQELQLIHALIWLFDLCRDDFAEAVCFLQNALWPRVGEDWDNPRQMHHLDVGAACDWYKCVEECLWYERREDEEDMRILHGEREYGKQVEDEEDEDEELEFVDAMPPWWYAQQAPSPLATPSALGRSSYQKLTPDAPASNVSQHSQTNPMRDLVDPRIGEGHKGAVQPLYVEERGKKRAVGATDDSPSKRARVR